MSISREKKLKYMQQNYLQSAKWSESLKPNC